MSEIESGKLQLSLIHIQMCIRDRDCNILENLVNNNLNGWHNTKKNLPEEKLSQLLGWMEIYHFQGTVVDFFKRFGSNTSQ